MKKTELQAYLKSIKTKGEPGKGYLAPDAFQAAQVAVYVMAGGGIIGRLAAEQPADFYIDDRVSRRPYPKAQIYAAVAIMEAMAECNGMDPRHLPALPDFHNLGVF